MLPQDAMARVPALMDVEIQFPFKEALKEGEQVDKFSS